jgi:hypothetical protein
MSVRGKSYPERALAADCRQMPRQHHGNIPFQIYPAAHARKPSMSATTSWYAIARARWLSTGARLGVYIG